MTTTPSLVAVESDLDGWLTEMDGIKFVVFRHASL